MDHEHEIPNTIDNELEGMRMREGADLRSQDLQEPTDDELAIEIDPIDTDDGTPDQITAFEQVQATWNEGSPETSFDASPPENEDEAITRQSVRAERDPDEQWRDEDIEELDAHSSLDV